MSIIFIFLYFLFLTNQKKINPLLYSSFKNYILFIFPTIFCSLLYIDLFKDSHIINYTARFFHRINKKLFNLKYYESTKIIILSIFCGSPTNAKLINEALKNERIDLNEANLLIPITSFMSISYMISIIYLYNYGIRILLTIYLGNLFYLFLKTSNYNKNMEDCISKVNNPKINLFNSIKNNSLIALNLFGTITFFSSICALISLIFPQLEKYLFLIELTYAIKSVSNNTFLLIISLTFLGLCMQFQIKEFLEISTIKLIFEKIIIVIIILCFYYTYNIAIIIFAFLLFYRLMSYKLRTKHLLKA